MNSAVGKCYLQQEIKIVCRKALLLKISPHFLMKMNRESPIPIQFPSEVEYQMEIRILGTFLINSPIISTNKDIKIIF